MATLSPTSARSSTYRQCINLGCTNHAPLRCVKCKSVYYCCVACQSVDWQKHKKECGVFQGINRQFESMKTLKADDEVSLERASRELDEKIIIASLILRSTRGENTPVQYLPAK